MGFATNVVNRRFTYFESILLKNHGCFILEEINLFCFEIGPATKVIKKIKRPRVNYIGLIFCDQCVTNENDERPMLLLMGISARFQQNFSKIGLVVFCPIQRQTDRQPP